MSGPEAGGQRPLLAIDTSTLVAGLALYGADGVVAELSWPAGRAQTTAILAEIDRLLALSGLRPADLGAVAAATGPGSFNGLRVGLSAAKGLAFALDLPLLGVPTLDVAAYPHVGDGVPVRAVIAAGRGRLVSAPYRQSEGRVHREGEYANTTLEELAALIEAPTIICGELSPTALDAVQALAPGARRVPPALNARRAAYLAELAWARLCRGERDAPDTLEPLYLHGPAAGGGTPAPEGGDPVAER